MPLDGLNPTCEQETQLVADVQLEQPEGQAKQPSFESRKNPALQFTGGRITCSQTPYVFRY